jgi:hypothetical protein
MTTILKYFSVKSKGALDACGTFVLFGSRPSFMSSYEHERYSQITKVTARNTENAEVERFGIREKDEYLVWNKQSKETAI